MAAASAAEAAVAAAHRGDGHAPVRGDVTGILIHDVHNPGAREHLRYVWRNADPSAPGPLCWLCVPSCLFASSAFLRGVFFFFFHPR